MIINPLKRTNIMSTQPINNPKNKETLKNVATVAAAAVAGAGTVIAAESFMADDNNEAKVVEPTPVVGPEPGKDDNPVKPEENTADAHDNNSTTTADAGHHAADAGEHGPQAGGVEQPHHQPEPTPVEPEHHTADPASADNDPSIVEGLPDVDPAVVAQNVTSGEFVDPTDIDDPNLPIAAVGTVETVDGEVLQAAQIVGANGENLYMIDVDGDNQYDYVADAAGNVLGDVPTHLTVSDSQSLLAENSGEHVGYTGQDQADSQNNDDDVNASIDQDILTI